MADPGFPRGSPSLRGTLTYYLTNSSWKLHEMKKFWPGEGTRPWRPPQDPPRGFSGALWRVISKIFPSLVKHFLYAMNHNNRVSAAEQDVMCYQSGKLFGVTFLFVHWWITVIIFRALKWVVYHYGSLTFYSTEKWKTRKEHVRTHLKFYEAYYKKNV